MHDPALLERDLARLSDALLGSARTLGGAPMGPLTTVIGYNDRGDVTGIDYPGPRNLTIGRDDAGMLQTITEGSTEIVDYDYLGRTRVSARRTRNDGTRKPETSRVLPPIRLLTSGRTCRPIRSPGSSVGLNSSDTP